MTPRKAQFDDIPTRARIMFSSVFDKVVSTTAPSILKTFPPRDALPVPASTLCCLSFVDRFLSKYPSAGGVAAAAKNVDDDVSIRNTDRATTDGLAVSIDEIDIAMQNASELGGRLAAALAGTTRGRNGEPSTVPVPDLLAKVRGIFGNRLTSVGRDIRVVRDPDAERDETLLLRQVHTIKNAVLDAFNGSKWCAVVTSAGESLAVCSIPLPPAGGEGEYGCDFLLFDPWPRPAMHLQGSYVVKFTTVRGLQLHLLSALGEIWERVSPSMEKCTKGEFVGISIVMAARAPGSQTEESEAMRMLEASVTRLRKAEKAAAINIKRNEIEGLRRALAETGKEQLLSSGPDIGNRLLSVKENGVPAAGDNLGLRAPSSTFVSSHWPNHPDTHPRRNHPRPANDESVQAEADQGIDSAERERAQPDREAFAGQLSGEQQVDLDAEPVRLAFEQGVSCTPPPLHSPRQGTSPPLTKKTNRDATRGQIERDGPQHLDIVFVQSFGMTSEANEKPMTAWLEQNGMEGGGGDCPAAGRITPKEFARQGCRGHSDEAGRMQRIGSDKQHEDPLQRALLRSVEHEQLTEYTKRAYNVYRMHGVLQDGGGGRSEGSGPRVSVIKASSPNVRDMKLNTILPNGPARTQLSSEMTAPVLSPRPGDGEAVQEANASVPADDVSTMQAMSPANDQGSAGCVGGYPTSPGREPSTPSPADGTAIPTAMPTPQRKEAQANSSSTGGTKGPLRAFRSRLRAPRAGRRLALASANARGKRSSYGHHKGCLGQDACGNVLPPPPPTTSVSAHSQRAHCDGQSVDSGSLQRHRTQDQNQLGAGMVTTPLPLPGGGYLPTAPDVLVQDTVRSECPRDKGADPERCSSAGTLDREDEIGQPLPPHVGSPVQSECRQRERSSGDVDKFSSHTPSNDRAHVRRDICRVSEASRAKLPAEGDVHDSYAPYTHARVSTMSAERAGDARAETAASPDHIAAESATAQPITRQSRKTPFQSQPDGESDEAVGPCLSRSHASLSAETPPGQLAVPVDTKFVWFGQPDSPSATRRSGECNSDDPGVLHSGGSTKDGQSAALQRRRNRERAVLRMEVQRQRDAVERAFRAREGKRRMRRLQLGAEVLLGVMNLMQTDEQRAQSTHRTHYVQVTDMKETREADHNSNTPSSEPRGHRLSDSCETYAVQPDPREVDAPQGTRPLKAELPSGEGEAAQSAYDPAPEPRTICRDEGVLVATAGSRALVPQRATMGEPSTTRGPAPPPISFDVTADNLKGAGSRFAQGGLHDEARRRERFEALRERKVAEAEDRRRHLRDRRAAARRGRLVRHDAPKEQREDNRGFVRGTEGIIADRRGGVAMSNVSSPSARESTIRCSPSDSEDAPPSDDHGAAPRCADGGLSARVERHEASGIGRAASPMVRGLSRRSNRKLVRNAVNFLCLAGGHLREKKMQVLEALDKHPASNFVLLLAHTKLLAFKGLYACSADRDGSAERVFGLGPDRIDVAMVAGFFKYNSAAREFREVHSKSLGETTDAVSMEPTKLRRPKSSVPRLRV